jgi:hypothetical protein
VTFHARLEITKAEQDTMNGWATAIEGMGAITPGFNIHGM